MRAALTYVLACLLLLVPGCAQLNGVGDALFVTPQTPQQAVFEAEGHYLAVKTLAAKYSAQASCGTPGAKPAPLCSSSSVVNTIDKTEIAVEETLAAAERTVTNPSFHWEKGAALPDAVIVAANAVTAFANIVAATGVK